MESLITWMLPYRLTGRVATVPWSRSGQCHSEYRFPHWLVGHTVSVTTPSLSAAAFVAARSRAVVSSGRGAQESVALPVLLVGLALCVAGYAELGWWLLQTVLGLFA